MTIHHSVPSLYTFIYGIFYLIILLSSANSLAFLSIKLIEILQGNEKGTRNQLKFHPVDPFKKKFLIYN